MNVRKMSICAAVLVLSSSMASGMQQITGYFSKYLPEDKIGVTTKSDIQKILGKKFDEKNWIGELKKKHEADYATSVKLEDLRIDSNELFGIKTEIKDELYPGEVTEKVLPDNWLEELQEKYEKAFAIAKNLKDITKKAKLYTVFHTALENELGKEMVDKENFIEQIKIKHEKSDRLTTLKTEHEAFMTLVKTYGLKDLKDLDAYKFVQKGTTLPLSRVGQEILEGFELEGTVPNFTTKTAIAAFIQSQLKDNYKKIKNKKKTTGIKKKFTNYFSSKGKVEVPETEGEEEVPDSL